MSLPTALLLFIASVPSVLGHGVLTWPPSTRQNGSMAHAGSCAFDDCIWYSDFVTIPGEPLVNKEAHRTFNVKTQSGESDWSRKNPWRAPGTAPIFGSGCGVYGGRQEFVIDSSGNLLGVHLAGKDGANLPAKEPTVWPQGSVQEVAWAITANHGGGYSYRLCPKTSNITEECFQQHVLSFHGDKQWLVYGNMTQMFWSKWIPRRIKHNAFVLGLWTCVWLLGTYPLGRPLSEGWRFMFAVSFFARVGYSAAWMFITNFTHSLPWNEFLAQDPGRTWPVLHNVMAMVLGGKHRWNEMLFHDVHHAFPNAVGTLSQRGRFHGWEKVHDAAAEVLHRGLWKPNGDEETQMQKTQKKRSLMMKQGK